MPQTPGPLPLALRGVPFAVADHPELPRSRTRASDLWIPARGVRLPAAMRELEDRCRAHALTLPAGAVFSDATAARLWLLPLPRRLCDDTLHITMPGSRAVRRRDRVRGHSRTLALGEHLVHRDLPVTTPARTFLDLAAELDLRELVAVVDRILSRRDPLATREELRILLAAHTGARGMKDARLALDLADERSESPKESELRMLLVGAGHTGLRVNLEVFDEHGRFVARVDIGIPEHRIALEYEGDHHRDRAQWQRDLARRRRLEALGWTYLTVTQTDLDHPARLLADLDAAIRRATGRSWRD